MIVLAQHPATPDHPAPAEVRSVEVTDAAFAPSGLVVAPGTAVTWRNNGRQRHSATADGGAFASPTLSPGDRFTVAAPATAGVYVYGCRFHSYMRGTVTVSMLSLAAPGPWASAVARPWPGRSPARRRAPWCTSSAASRAPGRRWAPPPPTRPAPTGSRARRSPPAPRSARSSATPSARASAPSSCPR